MNLLADEGIDRQIVDRLRKDGHDVSYIAEMEPGISDISVLNIANQNKALLLVEDKDFSELVFRQRRFIKGVVLIRLAGLSARSKVDIIASAINSYGKEMEEAFTVITPGAMRIRRSKK